MTDAVQAKKIESSYENCDERKLIAWNKNFAKQFIEPKMRGKNISVKVSLP